MIVDLDDPEVSGTFEPFNLDKDCVPGDQYFLSPIEPECTSSTYQKIQQLAANPDSYNQAEQLRNILQDHLVTLSNQKCEKHLAAVYGSAATANFATSELAAALSGAATIVTGGLASAILSGSSAFASHTRAQIGNDFYQGLFASAIIREIRKDRERTSELLTSIRQYESITRYSAADAIRDADAYHQKCSFYNGIAVLTSETNREQTVEDFITKQLGEVEARLTKVNQQIAGVYVNHPNADIEDKSKECLAEVTAKPTVAAEEVATSGEEIPTSQELPSEVDTAAADAGDAIEESEPEVEKDGEGGQIIDALCVQRRALLIQQRQLKDQLVLQGFVATNTP